MFIVDSIRTFDILCQPEFRLLQNHSAKALYLIWLFQINQTQNSINYFHTHHYCCRRRPLWSEVEICESVVVIVMWLI